MNINLSDIVEKGLELERKGEEFYRKAAQLLLEEKTRKEFLALADKEKDHEKFFEELKENISNIDNTSGSLKSDVLPLEIIVDGLLNKFETAPDEIFTGLESSGNILAFAIQIEKDFIVYYNLLASIITNEQHLKIINRILLEEVEHLAVVSGIINE